MKWAPTLMRWYDYSRHRSHLWTKTATSRTARPSKCLLISIVCSVWFFFVNRFVNPPLQWTNEIMSLWTQWQTCFIIEHVHYDIQYIFHIPARFFLYLRQNERIVLVVTDSATQKKAAEKFSFLRFPCSHSCILIFFLFILYAEIPPESSRIHSGAERARNFIKD